MTWSFRRPFFQRDKVWESARNRVHLLLVVHLSHHSQGFFTRFLARSPSSQQGLGLRRKPWIGNSFRSREKCTLRHTQKNDDAGKNFALTRGQSGDGYDMKTQQSTTISSQYVSWARFPHWFRIDWSTVALIFSPLVRGPYLQFPTQVDCFES